MKSNEINFRSPKAYETTNDTLLQFVKLHKLHAMVKTVSQANQFVLMQLRLFSNQETIKFAY